MPANLVLALKLTVVGMGLVFGSILVFWALMAGLVRVTAAGAAWAARRAAGGADARAAAEDELARVEAEAAALAEAGARQTAAALAVAVLLARDVARPPRGAAPDLSAWRAAARVGR